MLVHKVYKSYLEVDKANVEVIEKLPPPISVNGVCSFMVMQVFAGDSSRIFPILHDPCAIFWRRR